MNARPKAPWFESPWPLAALIAALAVGWSLFFRTPLETQENRWFDQILRFRYAQGMAPAADPRIVHLDITLSDFANLPTIESEYDAARRLIAKAGELGAALIVIDVIYYRGTREMAQPILQAIGSSRGVVLAEGLVHGTAKRGRPTGGEKKIRSFPFLTARYRPSGLINIEADTDGVYRRYAYLHRTSSGLEPSLALAAYFQLKGIKWPEEVALLDDHTVQWQELSPDGLKMVPNVLRALEGATRPLLDFRSGWTGTGSAAFPHLALSELEAMNARYFKEGGARPLEGKIVFVSYVASGLGDFGVTPFGPHQPLVQLHSMALNDLLQSTLHFRVPRWADACFFALVLAMGLIARLARPKWLLIALWLVCVALVLAAGVGLALKTPWVMPSVSLAALFTIALFAELARRHTLELVERLKLETTMGYYFSPRVLTHVLEDPGSMEPQQAEVTALLTDLRNFTPMSERLGTKGIFDLCNQVFEAETRAVMEEDGSLEHFLGDQFLAYWGAPDPQPDATERALRASFVLIKAMEGLRARIPAEVQDLFGYGVALHAGVALVGNKGSKQRLDYGLLGDIINSAARVESLTKYYRVPFIITRDAYERLPDHPPYRWLDSVLPVGKSTPLDLMEIAHPLSTPDFSNVLREYAAAFVLYREGNFRDARDKFRAIYETHHDMPSRLLAERCEAFLNAPPVQWKGVYRFTSK